METIASQVTTKAISNPSVQREQKPKTDVGAKTPVGLPDHLKAAVQSSGVVHNRAIFSTFALSSCCSTFARQFEPQQHSAGASRLVPAEASSLAKLRSTNQNKLCSRSRVLAFF
jgi:hypothetical protein